MRRSELPPPESWGRPPKGVRPAPPPKTQPQPDLSYVAYLKEKRYQDPYTQRDAFDTWYTTKIEEAKGSERDRLNREREAVVDVLLTNHKRAIDTLLAIESDYPGHYSTASTLGTAYELAGDNEKALQWIKIGIERDPDSHYGTEWLHVRILESKLALADNPGFLANNPIVPPPGQDPAEQSIAYRGTQLGTLQVLDALQFQLGERMLFVKPEDAVVADLLHSYAAWDASIGSVGLMALAEEYGFDESMGYEEESAIWQPIRNTWMPVGVCIAVFGIVFFLKARA